MKVVVQRVRCASVSVSSKVVSKIDYGLLLLIAIAKDDTVETVTTIAEKIVNLRIMPDDKGKMNLSIRDVVGEILVVSQFTLIADLTKGNRPYFGRAASPDTAEKLYQVFIDTLSGYGLLVESGVFGAMMEVELINDGPVTIVFD